MSPRYHLGPISQSFLQAVETGRGGGQHCSTAALRQCACLVIERVPWLFLLLLLTLALLIDRVDSEFHSCPPGKVRVKQAGSLNRITRKSWFQGSYLTPANALLTHEAIKINKLLGAQ